MPGPNPVQPAGDIVLGQNSSGSADLARTKNCGVSNRTRQKPDPGLNGGCRAEQKEKPKSQNRL